MINIDVKYSQEALDEMAQKVDLLDYASRSVDFVKRSGNIHFAICPFHNERTASLAVDAEEQFFKCYGCGKWGNIYTWIQLTENLTFDQAVKKVADMTGSDADDYVESETMAFFKFMERLKTKKERPKIERKTLDLDRDYKKKFKKEVPQEWVDEGILPDVMDKYEIMIDPLSNRIVYPVYSDDDELISVKGRTRFKDYKSLKIMKYMNYHRIGTLDYFQGMKQARKYIKDKNEIIIFEGIKSVMKVDGWGYHNAVAAETSYLNDYQIELLIKMNIHDVVIAFDKDVPMGKINDCTKLLNRFTNVWVIYDKWKLLDEKDSPPDKGRIIWQELYERRMRI